MSLAHSETLLVSNHKTETPAPLPIIDSTVKMVAFNDRDQALILENDEHDLVGGHRTRLAKLPDGSYEFEDKLAALQREATEETGGALDVDSLVPLYEDESVITEKGKIVGRKTLHYYAGRIIFPNGEPRVKKSEHTRCWWETVDDGIHERLTKMSPRKMKAILLGKAALGLAR